MITSKIRYKVSNNRVNYGFSVDTYEINGKVRKCTVEWDGPDKITSRNQKDINETEFMDVRQVFTELNSRKDLITSAVQRNTPDVLEYQREIAKLRKQYKPTIRTLFWTWFHLNKVVVCNYSNQVFFVSKVKSSGIPILSYVAYNELSENISTYVEDFTFDDNDCPPYMFNCSLEDVLSGKVVRNNKTSNSHSTEQNTLTRDMITCGITELACPEYVEKSLKY